MYESASNVPALMVIAVGLLRLQVHQSFIRDPAKHERNKYGRLSRTQGNRRLRFLKEMSRVRFR